MCCPTAPRRCILPFSLPTRPSPASPPQVLHFFQLVRNLAGALAAEPGSCPPALRASSLCRLTSALGPQHSSVWETPDAAGVPLGSPCCAGQSLGSPAPSCGKGVLWSCTASCREKSAASCVLSSPRSAFPPPAAASDQPLERAKHSSRAGHPRRAAARAPAAQRGTF